MNIPKDPIMMLSFVNTQLRDNYSSLSDLAKSFGEDENVIIEKLAEVGYSYNVENNQFVRSV